MPVLADKLNVLLLGDLDAPSRGLSSRTPILIERLGQRPEIGSVLRVRFPVSWPRYALQRGPGQASALGWRLHETGQDRYRAEWAVPFPHQQTDWLSRLNEAWLPYLARRLETAFARATGRSDYLLWLAHPLLAACLPGLSPRLTVFDAIDNFLEHPQFRHLKGTLQRGYDQIGERADLILSTAERGPSPWASSRAAVQHVPNGVDAAAFKGPFAIPAALQALPRPRLGYVGVLQDRIDRDLVLAMAKRYAQASFVFVGPIFGDPGYFAPLQALPNVHFLGPVPYAEVPAYMAHLDVCLLPHRQNAFTASMNPLKLYEYLAAGRPIVSTPVPPTERFQDVIHIAATPGAFARAIGHAVSEADDPIARSRRQAVARSQDWSLRVQDIWRLINQSLRQGGAAPLIVPTSLGHWEW